MAKLTKIKSYTKEFYKSLTPELQQIVYEGAIHLAQGFIQFDSLHFASTGGGPLSLAGRLSTLQAVYPYLLYLSAKMADGVGLLELRTFNKFKQTDIYKQAVLDKLSDEKIKEKYVRWLTESFEEEKDTSAFDESSETVKEQPA